MYRQNLLQALIALGVDARLTGLNDASDVDGDQMWERLRQAPLAFSVDKIARLSLIDINSSALNHAVQHFALAEPGQAAYRFFLEVGAEVRDVLGVFLIEADDTLRRTCFAEIHLSIDEVNAAANAAEIPIRFYEEISAGEKWRRQVQSGKIVGMDDPVWMAKAQEEIDAVLEQLRVKKKSS